MWNCAIGKQDLASNRHWKAFGRLGLHELRSCLGRFIILEACSLLIERRCDAIILRRMRHAPDPVSE